MTRVLTPNQQRLARTFSWTAVDALLGDIGRISEYGGSSHCGLGEPGDWIEYNRTRAVVGPIGVLRKHKEARIAVTWAAVAKHGSELDADLIADLRESRRISGLIAESAHKHWRYSSSMDPVARWSMDAWVSGHCERTRKHREEQGRLLDRAFPLAAADIHPAHDDHEVRMVRVLARCITCHLDANIDPVAHEAERRAHYGITDHEPTDLLELLAAMA